MDNDGSEDSDYYEVDPNVVAATAASLVARFAAAIRATKELQALQNRPRLLALEKLVFKCLYAGDAAFLNQKRLFRMMPGRLLEKINRELGSQWRCLPLVGVMANPHTRHISLHLDKPAWNTEEGIEGWSLQQLQLLFGNIAQEGKNSLRSLEIRSLHKPEGKNPGLHSTQLGSLLLELRALTSLHLQCNFQTYEIDLLVSILASTNPDIRSLRLPNLSNKSLRTIADRWPQLEFLQPDQPEFDSSQLEAVLPRLRNLETIAMSPMNLYGVLCEAMLSVARAHDPASPPYKLAQEFIFPSHKPVNSEDMVKLFTAFPALHWLTLEETDIPAVCAGLEGREHVHITDLEVQPTSSNPRALEPLLARVGEHLIELEIPSQDGVNNIRLDLNMIGHYCPNLEDISVSAAELIAGDEFEVTKAHFSKLQRCTVHHNVNTNGPADLPTALVSSLMASPTLESIDMKGVPITEEVVAALAAEREQGALSSLEELEVWYHPSLDVGVLAGLASHAPRLRHITFNTRNEEDGRLVEMKQVLDSFGQQSELKFRVCVNEW